MVSDTKKGHLGTPLPPAGKNTPMLHKTRSVKLQDRYTMENPTYMPRMSTHYGMELKPSGAAWGNMTLQWPPTLCKCAWAGYGATIQVAGTASCI